eukprot:6456298-Prymnesium_polylepis.2
MLRRARPWSPRSAHPRRPHRSPCGRLRFAEPASCRRSPRPAVLAALRPSCAAAAAAAARASAVPSTRARWPCTR